MLVSENTDICYVFTQSGDIIVSSEQMFIVVLHLLTTHCKAVQRDQTHVVQTLLALNDLNTETLAPTAPQDTLALFRVFTYTHYRPIVSRCLLAIHS